MKNIKWKVESIEGKPLCTGDIEVTATLNGTLDWGFMGTLDGIASGLQATLDRENNKVYISSARECGKSQDQLELYREVMNNMRPYRHSISKPYVDPMEIKDVIFNDPATIVFWTDGTKTVVKCQEGDEFDPEKGLTMAIVKKVYGNKGSYCNEIKKWVEPYYEKQAEIENQKINEALEALAETAKKILGSVPTIKLNIESRKSDSGFVKVTEHYGYSCLTNKDGDSEYYVMHKDELVNFTATDAHNWTFHSKNRDYAVSMAHHLEYHHYISRGL